MSMYFISDLHLGCRDAYRFCNRPFPSYEHYVDVLLNNLNKQISYRDDLYIVGDLLDYNDNSTRNSSWSEASNLIANIPGRKHLIMGNNEERLANIQFNDQQAFDSFIKSKGIATVHNTADILLDGMVLHLVHRPVNQLPDRLNLYGHVHSELSVSPTGVNVSCNLLGYYALSEDSLAMMVDRFVKYTYPGRHMGELTDQFDFKLWDSYRVAWRERLTRIYNQGS